MSAQERVADYLGIDPADVDPVRAADVLREVQTAAADIDAGRWTPLAEYGRCRCAVRVADGYVAITPCNRHRGLTGNARWDWLSDLLSFASRFEAVTR